MKKLVLTSLKLASCNNILDVGCAALLTLCPRLTALDLSSSSAGRLAMETLGEHCGELLRLNVSRTDGTSLRPLLRHAEPRLVESLRALHVIGSFSIVTSTMRQLGRFHRLTELHVQVSSVDVLRCILAGHNDAKAATTGAAGANSPGCGRSLETLKLVADNESDIGDSFLDVVAQHCPNLVSLEARHRNISNKVRLALRYVK